MARGGSARAVAAAGIASALLVLASCAPPASTARAEPRPAEVTARSWSDSVLATLTVRQKAAQMVWPWLMANYASTGSAEWVRLQQMVREEQVGGIIISVGSPAEMTTKLNALQGESRLPLLVSADFEGGAGFRARAYFVPNAIDLGGATLFPQQMAIGASRDSTLAYELGRITALEGRALGVHVAFAPVLDVNNNPSNPVINIRSFGEDPVLVSRLGAAVVRGIQDHGMIATGKHFPGHGDTEVNSHTGLPVIPVTRARLDSVELPPFRSAIRAGVGMIMSAHIALPAITGDSLPATISPQVMRGVLRGDLGFDGLIVSDALDMRGVLGRMGVAEVAKRVVEAGVDVLLQPTNTQQMIDGIAEGVREGRYSEARIDSSVIRILRLKERMGLHRERLTDIGRMRAVVGDPAHWALARTAAERGITLVKDSLRTVPLALPQAPRRVLSVTIARREDLEAGRTFNAELARRYGSLRTVFVNAEDPGDELARVLRMVDSVDVTIVSSYALASFATLESAAPPQRIATFMRDVSRRAARSVIVSFYDPYLLRQVPEVPAYLIGWGGFPMSQRAAARALLGEIPITGTLPINIPPVARIGAGERRDVVPPR